MPSLIKLPGFLFLSDLCASELVIKKLRLFLQKHIFRKDKDQDLKKINRCNEITIKIKVECKIYAEYV